MEELKSSEINIRPKDLRVVIVVLVLVVFCLGLAPDVFADKPSTPCSYKKESANKEYFAVILVLPVSIEHECLAQGPEQKKEAAELRKQFPRSGVYSKASSQPLWQINWFASEVLVPNDGKHLIRKGPWASKETDEAVSFFAEGRFLKTYAVQDLIKDMSVLRRSVSHFQWSDGFVLDDSNNTLTISTLEGKKLVFSIESGVITPATQAETKGADAGRSCGSAAVIAGLMMLAVFRSK